MGARAAGMGYASSSLQDEWSVFNNVAGIAGIKATSLAATYSISPALQGANRTAFAATQPLGVGAIAVGAFHFGDELYSEQKLSVAYANKLGLASLGATVNYIQYNAEGFGTHGVAALSLGGIAELTSLISIGAHITNINQPYLTEAKDERLPTILTAGICLKPSDKVLLTTEVQKDIEYETLYKTGIEYRVKPKFIARTGFNINPNAFFAGMGFHRSCLFIDYAIQYVPLAIGYVHHASVNYQLTKK
jgi:hypothetical protein